MKIIRLQGGFTVIELVLVILIVALIGVAVNPFKNQVSLSLQAEARRVLSDIRYTQALSMATGERYRWVRTSASTYQIIDIGGTAIALPNGSTTLTLSAGNTFGSFANLPNNLLAFDTTGAPYITANIPGTPLSSTATITLNNGTQSRSITILAQTGYGALS